jgi:hypothetical protein
MQQPRKTVQQQGIHRNKTTDKTWEKSKANKIDLLCIGKSSALLSRGQGQKPDCKGNLKNKHYKSDSYLIR